MNEELDIDSVYITSEDVVARDIEGEFILVPLASGIGDMEDEMYTLNETGRAIWHRLDGKRSLKNIVESLNEEFEGSPGEIERDVLGIVKELFKRRMVVPV